MEIHRLTPMQEKYDSDLFSKLYEQTQGLRRSLVSQMDHRLFGVTPDILLSYFDDKFIFVFNKYYGKVSDSQLKGNIISALMRFKNKMLRMKAYAKNNIYANQISLDTDASLVNIIPRSEEVEDKELFLEMALIYLKKNLCDDALLILEIDLNPPPYILDRMVNPNTKIPAKLVAEYLDLEVDQDSVYYINDLRSEVNYWVKEAREHFSTQ